MEKYEFRKEYPLGTEVVYGNQIIRFSEGASCGQCAFQFSAECHNVRCSIGLYWKVVGDAPKKEFIRAIGEKFEYDGKWYEVQKAMDYCKGCAFRKINCFDKELNRGGCSRDGFKIFVEIPAPIKHDEPGVDFNSIMHFTKDISILKQIAVDNNVFITVEPVAKKDINTKAEDIIREFLSCNRGRTRNDITILLNEYTYELMRQYNRWSSITTFNSCRVRRSPDVKDIEIV